MDGKLLQYTNPLNYSQSGLAFHVDQSAFAHLGIPPSEFVEPDVLSFKKFVFVTSASSNHFNESMDMIASIQTHFPDKDVYFYDLGLTSYQIQEVFYYL